MSIKSSNDTGASNATEDIWKDRQVAQSKVACQQGPSQDGMLHIQPIRLPYECRMNAWVANKLVAKQRSPKSTCSTNLSSSNRGSAVLCSMVHPDAACVRKAPETRTQDCHPKGASAFQQISHAVEQKGLGMMSQRRGFSYSCTAQCCSDTRERRGALAGDAPAAAPSLLLSRRGHAEAAAAPAAAAQPSRPLGDCCSRSGCCCGCSSCCTSASCPCTSCCCVCCSAAACCCASGGGMGASCLLRLSGLPAAFPAAQPPSALPPATEGCTRLPSPGPAAAAAPAKRPATGCRPVQEPRSGDVVPDTEGLPLLLLPPKRGLYGRLPPGLDAKLRGTVVRLVIVLDSEDSYRIRSDHGTKRRRLGRCVSNSCMRSIVWTVTTLNAI